jgi:uncharacterized protein involved in exopolysaccharide biosynthesis
MEQHETEVDLIEILDVLWKRRRFILVPTILLALIAGIVSFLLHPKWEVDTIIQPSKLLIQSADGELKELLVTDPKQLANQINEEAYNRLISAKLNIALEDFPELKANNPRDTKLVRVSLRTKKPEQGQAILNVLFKYLKSELDRKAEVEIKSITTQIALKEGDINQEIKSITTQIALKESEIRQEIKSLTTQIAYKESDIKQKELDIESVNIDIERTQQEIINTENNLKISEERSRSIVEEMKGVKVRNDGIEKQQTTALAEKRGGGEALGLLLYSNEIQQNLRYYNTLENSLSEEKNKQENHRLLLRQKEQAIKGFKTQIDKIKQGIVDLRSQIELLNDKIKQVIVDLHSQTELLNDKIKQLIVELRSYTELLNEKKQRIDYAMLIKDPTVSLYPISPKKKLNIVIAGFLGLFCFSSLALFKDSVHKRNSRVKTGS